MTISQFKALLRRQGKTIREWAEENDFPPDAVYRVLNGIEKGNYGRAHTILQRAGVKGSKQPEQLAA